MKKFFLVMAMLFGMFTNSFAEESSAVNVSDGSRYELNINYRRLACVLDMSADQFEMSNYIMSEFERDMFFAKGISDEKSRNSVVSNAVKKNVKWMHYILNREQYRMYVRLLTLTLTNRGFDIDKIIIF